MGKVPGQLPEPLGRRRRCHAVRPPAGRGPCPAPHRRHGAHPVGGRRPSSRSGRGV